MLGACIFTGNVCKQTKCTLTVRANVLECIHMELGQSAAHLIVRREMYGIQQMYIEINDTIIVLEHIRCVISCVVCIMYTQNIQGINIIKSITL